MSIVEKIKNSLSEGTITILSSSVSVSAFSLFSDNKKVKEWHFIFQKIPAYQKQHFEIDLLGQDNTINAAFFRQYNLKQAIEFLKKDNVKLSYLKPGNRCSANMLYFKSDSQDKSFVFRSDLPFNDKTFDDNFPALELPVIIDNDKTADNEYGSSLERYKEVFENIQNKHTESYINDNGQRITLKEYILNALKKMLVEYTPKDIYNHILLNIYSKNLEIAANLDDIAYYRDTMICRHLRDYQKVAVSQLIRNIEDHNGAMLADAVGLGKTWTALGVIKYYMMHGFKICVIAPNSVKADWEQYLGGNGSCLDQDDFRFDLKTHSDLGRETQFYKDPHFRNRIEDPENHYLFVIDESHNFRSNNSRRERLKQCLSQPRIKTKVLLLTATPVNLKVNDLKAQFNLIARERNDAFNESMQIPNFHTVIDKVSKTIKNNINTDITIAELNRQIDDNFKRLISSLVVARTKKQLQDAGINIKTPTANNPEIKNIDPLEQATPKLTIDDFEKKLPLHLTCYSPNFYTEKLEQKFDNPALRTVHLRGMLVSGIIKRLESSWFSCQSSLQRMLAAHEALKNAIDNQGQKLDNMQVGEDDIDDTFDLPDSITWDNIEEIKSKGNFKTFKDDLDDDIQRLTELLNIFDNFSPEKDGKLTYLQDVIRKRFEYPKNNGRKKVLIFTTYEETAQYLYNEMSKKFQQIAMISGNKSASEKRDILDRFAPYTRLYRSHDWNPDLDTFEKWREWLKTQDTPRAQHCKKLLDDELEILIATDCLSEGTNIQDADFIINYDIHWNPVRLLQRLGRINRVESPNDEIDALNFMPPEGIEAHLGLIQRIKNRIKQAAGVVQTEVATQAAPDSDTVDQLNEYAEGASNPEQTSREITQVAAHWSLGDTPNVAVESANLYDLPQDAAFTEALNIRKTQKNNLPNGAFSGVQVQSEDGTGYVFLVKKKNCDFEQNPYRLIQIKKNNGKYELAGNDFQATLKMLKKYKDEKRFVSDNLNKSDPDYLKSVAKILTDHLSGTNKRKEEQNLLEQLLQGNMQVDMPEENHDYSEYELIGWLELNQSI